MPVLTANEQIQLCQNVFPDFSFSLNWWSLLDVLALECDSFPTPPCEGSLFCETTLLLPLWAVRIEMLWCSFSGYLTLLSSGQSNISKGPASLPELHILCDSVLRLSIFNLNFKKQPGTYFFMFFVRTGLIERKIGEVWHIRSIDPMSLLLSRLFFSN